jgi:hypothetical protein
MTKKKGAIIIATALTLGFASLIIYIKIIKSNFREEQRKKSFSGVIEQMTFDEKHIPEVIIKGDKYYLGLYDPGIRHIIQVDDSIAKELDSLNYSLYRKDSLGVWKLIHKEKEKDVVRFPFGKL